jgi:hypothetical protein
VEFDFANQSTFQFSPDMVSSRTARLWLRVRRRAADLAGRTADVRHAPIPFVAIDQRVTAQPSGDARLF